MLKTNANDAERKRSRRDLDNVGKECSRGDEEAGEARREREDIKVPVAAR